MTENTTQETQFQPTENVTEETRSLAAACARVTDPDTSDCAGYFSPSTLDNGRLWVDKTVTVKPSGNDFSITLSALSQSYAAGTPAEPTDAVFILDVSGSMHAYKLGEMTRAAVMTHALNGAIHELMLANPDNRVAVVSYGGYAQKTGKTTVNLSSADRLLPLNHYSVSNGRYFVIDGSNIKAGEELEKQAGAASVSVDGGTPTQRGIYEGAKVLMENGDTAYTHVSDGGNTVSLIRRPVIVLLTDGQPTYAWRNYRIAGESTDDGYDSGNGANEDLGISLLTILTAAYWKRQVAEHYYGPSSGRSPRFYTIGVGVSSGFATAVMDPRHNAGNVNSIFNGVEYNLKTLLNDFVSGRLVMFPILKKGSAAKELTAAVNPGIYINDYHYTDAYYPANDSESLKDAFDSIAGQIVSKGCYATETDAERPNITGYLTFSDILGRHMVFKGYEALILDGKTYRGGSPAQELIGGETPHLYATVLAGRLGVSEDAIEGLLASCAAGGPLNYGGGEDSRFAIKYYADSDAGYRGPYYDKTGGTAPPPDGSACVIELYPSVDAEVYNDVAGETTNLIHAYMTVTTALTPGAFTVQNAGGITLPLDRGQQMVGWHIPSSLIPMRSVTPVFDGHDELCVGRLSVKETQPIRIVYTVGPEDGLTADGLSADSGNCPNGKGGFYLYSNEWQNDSSLIYGAAAAFFQPNKANAYYYFTKDTPVCTKDGGPAESIPDGTDYCVLSEYYDQTADGYLVKKLEPADRDIIKTDIPPDGKPYIPAGTRTKNYAAEEPKAPNTTQTHEFRLLARHIGDMEINLLGNNGRIEIMQDEILELETPEETAQVVGPEVDEASQVIEPEADEASQDVEPEADEASQDVEPEADEASQDVEPEAEEAEQDIEPEADEASQDDEPETEEAEQDVEPETEEAEQDVEPETEEAEQDVEPEAEEAEQDVEPEADEAHIDASFEDITILGDEDQPLFLLSDVCDALECGDVDEIAAGLDPDEITTVKQDPGEPGQKIKGKKGKTGAAVNLPGLYKIIFLSESPKAKLMEHWVNNSFLRGIGRPCGKCGDTNCVSATKLMAVVSYVRALRSVMEKLCCCPKAIARMTEFVCVSYGLAFPPGFADCEGCEDDWAVK